MKCSMRVLWCILIVALLTSQTMADAKEECDTLRAAINAPEVGHIALCNTLSQECNTMIETTDEEKGSVYIFYHTECHRLMGEPCQDCEWYDHFWAGCLLLGFDNHPILGTIGAIKDAQDFNAAATAGNEDDATADYLYSMMQYSLAWLYYEAAVEHYEEAIVKGDECLWKCEDASWNFDEAEKMPPS